MPIYKLTVTRNFLFNTADPDFAEVIEEATTDGQLDLHALASAFDDDVVTDFCDMPDCHFHSGDATITLADHNEVVEFVAAEDLDDPE